MPDVRAKLIFRNLYELTGCSKPILRLWLNSMEEAEIRRARDLRPGADYDRLFAAAHCGSAPTGSSASTPRACSPSPTTAP